ncbi:hypothetical protein [Aureimonas phyllosphaerae]|uniref:DUF3606 domain-containing protein n=1 Tax=Aureimonas phyllosphaerae TaxID=1166078 RepID=A0A7W6BU83_9HYPH|nr:hypothetical protein [Aureimonas phyllosphaerae]MBB3934750.1 hypothetical protein [Aureimonas phyllosphaerae]MBB3958035.1 hypothetical protein [Aureimonas phyllosphaerae]SFE90718.1 hypothetical protein SAMN05216566_1012 [Aureimonas phyllosphaerae]
MSNIPLENADPSRPDPEAEEMAAKHNISVEDAKRHLREQKHDGAAADGAAETEKRESSQ